VRLALALGASLLVAGVAGLIIAPEYAPGVMPSNGLPGSIATTGSSTSYDAIRIASWACLIVGGLSALFGLSVSLRRPQGFPGI
jgi:hypothetical protein